MTFGQTCKSRNESKKRRLKEGWGGVDEVGLTWNRSCLASKVMENGSRSLSVRYFGNKVKSHRFKKCVNTMFFP